MCFLCIFALYFINDNYDNNDNKKNVDHAPAGSTFHFSLFSFHCYGTGLALAVWGRDVARVLLGRLR